MAGGKTERVKGGKRGGKEGGGKEGEREKEEEREKERRKEEGSPSIGILPDISSILLVTVDRAERILGESRRGWSSDVEIYSSCNTSHSKAHCSCFTTSLMMSF